MPSVTSKCRSGIAHNDALHPCRSPFRPSRWPTFCLERGQSDRAAREVCSDGAAFQLQLPALAEPPLLGGTSGSSLAGVPAATLTLAASSAPAGRHPHLIRRVASSNRRSGRVSSVQSAPIMTSPVGPACSFPRQDPGPTQGRNTARRASRMRRRRGRRVDFGERHDRQSHRQARECQLQSQ